MGADLGGKPQGEPMKTMSATRFREAALSHASRPPAARGPGVARPARGSLMRRMRVQALTDPLSGAFDDFERILPALPVFEEAFCALARGMLISTDRGVVAVEDILPGDSVKLADGRFEQLLWKGTTPIHPHAPGQRQEMSRLTRIAADALGIARPMHDLVLGPAARIAMRGRHVPAGYDAELAMIPAAHLVDGSQIIEIAPPGAVPTFHLGFARHERMVVQGVEMESYHPGIETVEALSPELRALFLSLFPHVASPDDFGPVAWPRIDLAEPDRQVA